MDGASWKSERGEIGRKKTLGWMWIYLRHCCLDVKQTQGEVRKRSKVSPVIDLRGTTRG